jgi:hypothetical protein
MVGVGLGCQRGGNEPLARDLAHRGQHPRISDPADAQALHHGGTFVVGVHQLSLRPITVPDRPLHGKPITAPMPAGRSSGGEIMAGSPSWSWPHTHMTAAS